MIPSAKELALLTFYLQTANLTLKLYSNNVTPAKGDTSATYTEVIGGGYAAKTLTTGNWTLTAGTPTTGTYNTAQDFTFTGVTNSPAVVYGYFVVDSLNALFCSERFPSGVIPFPPINGSLIRVLPKFNVN